MLLYDDPDQVYQIKYHIRLVHVRRLLETYHRPFTGLASIRFQGNILMHGT
jgi:hypothetical protein